MSETINTKKPFRILCLDGGGIRGVISARILQEVEKQIQDNYQQTLAQYFDLIAGTSTGSLLAAGIAMGYTCQDLIELYQKNGMDIFPYRSLASLSRWKLLLQYGMSCPKFANDGLIKVLTELPMFQQEGRHILLKEVGKHEAESQPNPILLILAYDAKYRNTTFFTNHHPGSAKRWFDNLPLWKICLASAAAPTYFPAVDLTNTETGKLNTGEEISETWSFPHVDGGVTANNPSLCAISQAITLGQRLEDIQLLSIGTGQNKKPMEFQQVEGWGLIQWGLRIADVFMEGQAELQDGVCQRLMGGKSSNRYLRLQFDLNDSFAKPRNRLAQPAILANTERKNSFFGKHLSESMDDASPENIARLIEAAQQYAEQQNLYEGRFEHYGPVKQAIEEFHKNPQGERQRHPKQAQ
jgi:patatin-like phospholipase/acyl hydrolase